MNYKKLIILAAALALCAGAAAETARAQQKAPVAYVTADGRGVTDRTWGIYRPYPETVPAMIKAPKGYKPVYISHYGRHGSRFAIPDTIYTYVNNILEKAYADGKLTDDGIKLRDHYVKVYPLMNGRGGELSFVGQAQHKAIATRMYNNFPKLLSGKARVIANSTYYERTILSMMAFCDGLHLCNSKMDIIADASIKDMYYLNPHIQSNPYARDFDRLWKGTDPIWKPQFLEFCKKHIDYNSFACRIFNDLDYAGKLTDLLKFDECLFYLARDLPDTHMEQDNYFRFWTFDELEWMGKCYETYFYYIMKGLHPDGMERAASLCEALLNDIIVRTEGDIQEGVKARLRFGHDGCLMAMFALMGLPGWDARESDPEKFSDVWSDAEIPMAANIQMVVYQGKTADDLILCWLLNEKPMKLSIREVSPDFYSWKDFKEYYSGRVKAGREHIIESNRVLDNNR